VRRIYYRKHRRRRGAQKRLIILLACTLLLILSIITIRSLLNNFIHPSRDVKSAKSDTETIITEQEPTHAQSIQKPNSSTLGKVIGDTLVGTKGSYGIIVQNLKTNEYYATNEHTKYNSASLYKLWVMLTVFDQINNGTLSRDTILNQDVKILNKKFNIGSESAEQTEGTIKMSVGDALEKMIVISDNYSALLLTEKVKLSAISSLLKKNGLYESQLGKSDTPPITTPYDIGLFFEKLYQGKLADKKTTDEMITLLKNQRLNDKIPRYLPDNIIAAHKTGELEEYSHDAGILYTPDYDYILVALTKSDNPEAAEVRISNISQEVFGYFNHN